MTEPDQKPGRLMLDQAKSDQCYLPSNAPENAHGMIGTVNQFSYYQNLRSEVAALLPSSYSKVLEVGCGAGTFRSNLAKPCEYWGIEPVPEVAQAAKTRLDKVLVVAADQALEQLPDSYFDLVICNDVLEHMLHPDLFLQAIKPKLSAQGAHLVGSIPNVRYIFNLNNLIRHKDWQYTDSGTLDRTHFRFFTEKSLKRMFIEVGFEIEAFAGINAVPTISVSSVRKFASSAFWTVLTSILGADTRFLQFAFRLVSRAHLLDLPA